MHANKLYVVNSYSQYHLLDQHAYSPQKMVLTTTPQGLPIIRIIGNAGLQILTCKYDDVQRKTRVYKWKLLFINCDVHVHNFTAFKIFVYKS